MRLIDADALKYYDNDTITKAYSKSEFDAWREGIELVKKNVKNAPTISWNEIRPTAHFVRGKFPATENGAFCSECDGYICEWEYSTMERHFYCRICGAKLEVPEE